MKERGAAAPTASGPRKRHLHLNATQPSAAAAAASWTAGREGGWGGGRDLTPYALDAYTIYRTPHHHHHHTHRVKRGADLLEGRALEVVLRHAGPREVGELLGAVAGERGELGLVLERLRTCTEVQRFKGTAGTILYDPVTGCLSVCTCTEVAHCATCLGGPYQQYM